MTKLLRILSLGFLLLGAIGQAQALSPAEVKRGVHYEKYSVAQPGGENGRISVIEVFSYGCIHCYRFEPVLKKWKQNKPANVDLVQMPVIFDPKNTTLLAKIFYTAESLGVLDTMHDKIFDAIHKEQNHMHDAEAFAEFFAKNGISKEEFNKHFNSMAVGVKVKRADDLTTRYKVSSTPSVIVDGKYLVLTDNIKTYDDIFVIIDTLINKIEKENKQ